MAIVRDISELTSLAEKFCSDIGLNRVFLFYGEMGAGKTTFIKEICKALGIKSEVTSPTFAIVNEYPCEKYRFVYHFDFYRINSVIEIFDIGFEEYLDSENILFIEWPENMKQLIPTASVSVNIVQMPDGTRVITWGD